MHAPPPQQLGGKCAFTSKQPRAFVRGGRTRSPPARKAGGRITVPDSAVARGVFGAVAVAALLCVARAGSPGFTVVPDSHGGVEVVVRPGGDVGAAIVAARPWRGAATVTLAAGTHRVLTPIIVGPLDDGLTLRGDPTGGGTVIDGGVVLPQFTEGPGGVWSSPLPGAVFNSSGLVPLPTQVRATLCWGLGEWEGGG
jgi:hypothetical protein